MQVVYPDVVSMESLVFHGRLICHFHPPGCQAIMNQHRIDQLATKLHQARISGVPIEPLTATHPDLSIDEAYHISLQQLEKRRQMGESVVGKKLALPVPPLWICWT